MTKKLNEEQYFGNLKCEVVRHDIQGASFIKKSLYYKYLRIIWVY